MENTAVTPPRHPSWWVPSLYFAQGIPYVVVMSLSVVMYKRLGISNTDIAFYTSWLNLPWVIKPLWSPLVDITRTKRLWVVTMQFLISFGLALAAASICTQHFLPLSLGLFGLMAFASATHDIAADGFYMLALSKHDQALWVGMRSVFYRTAMITGSGVLVMLAGTLEQMGNIPQAWSLTLGVVAVVFLLFSCWHLVVLPRPKHDGPVIISHSRVEQFFETLGSFFRKPHIVLSLAFILLYRFDEAQLSKVILPFLLDDHLKGGLALTTRQVGLAYGTIGVVSLLFGGLLGGFLAAKFGLKRTLPIMVGAMYLPKTAFLLLSIFQPANFPVICATLSAEQFGYGFGFSAFMLYMLFFADGPHRTAHYALCTGFMALGMMIPGMWSGWLVDQIGYQHFFIWTLCSTVPGLILALNLKIDPNFGKKVSH